MPWFFCVIKCYLRVNLKTAQIIINDIIDFYNNKRPHMSIGMMTPRQKRESYNKTA